MWHCITCETISKSMNFIAGIHVYVFFIFTTIFLSKQTIRIFQQRCRQTPWKSLECKWSPVVELSLLWVKPHLSFPSSSVYRCSTVSWGIPKTAASMTMDLRQAEQWLLLWACAFPCWTQETSPGAGVGTTVWKLPQWPPLRQCRGCRSVLLPQRPPQSQGSHDLQNLSVGIWHGSWRIYVHTQPIHVPFTKGSGLLVHHNPEGLISLAEYRNSNSN